MSSGKKYLAIVALALAGGSIYFIPYLRYYFQPQMLRAFNINNEQVGFPLTVYALVSLVLYIPGGILADRFSPKKTLVFSLLATAALGTTLAITLNYTISLVVWVLFAFSTNFVFWTSLIKAIRMVGEAKEQGKIYGLYYSGNGLVNTVVGFLAVAACGAATAAADDVAGLRAAIMVSVGTMVIAAVAVFFFFEERKKGEATDGVVEQKFTLKNMLVQAKNPLVWAIALLVFCTYGMFSSSSFFVSYLTDIFGVSEQTSSNLGVIRQSLFLIICAPIGGFIADKALKSTTKWFMIGLTLLGLTYLSFFLLPSDFSTPVVIALSLIPGALALMIYGIVFSVVEECKIPRNVTGIVVGLASLIGYLPDSFFATMFGQWIDANKEQGYRSIFLFLAGLCVIGFLLSFYIRRKTKDLPALPANEA